MDKSMSFFWANLAFNDTATISGHAAHGHPRISTIDVFRIVKLH